MATSERVFLSTSEGILEAMGIHSASYPGGGKGRFQFTPHCEYYVFQAHNTDSGVRRSLRLPLVNFVVDHIAHPWSEGEEPRDELEGFEFEAGSGVASLSLDARYLLKADRVRQGKSVARITGWVDIDWDSELNLEEATSLRKLAIPLSLISQTEVSIPSVIALSKSGCLSQAVFWCYGIVPTSFHHSWFGPRPMDVVVSEFLSKIWARVSSPDHSAIETALEACIHGSRVYDSVHVRAQAVFRGIDSLCEFLNLTGDELYGQLGPEDQKEIRQIRSRSASLIRELKQENTLDKDAKLRNERLEQIANKEKTELRWVDARFKQAIKRLDDRLGLGDHEFMAESWNRFGLKKRKIQAWAEMISEFRNAVTHGRTFRVGSEWGSRDPEECLTGHLCDLLFRAVLIYLEYGGQYHGPFGYRPFSDPKEIVRLLAEQLREGKSTAWAPYLLRDMGYPADLG